ncbi:MAG: hypothetical protein WAQ53_12530 [Thiofilum sp.]|uniref:hypothetical protein n=1 Tax=Thiofilum sp. TaxID=2212733 RepID=UPI0025F7AAD0|nr:hypothetical protein [Thiofilum sp.]MBK8454346.1 hypothetical protein [Thiofilum sp.]
MMHRSCLDNSNTTLVLDTSVIINLSKSKYSYQILEQVPNHLVVVNQVMEELQAGSSVFQDINYLIKQGILHLTKLDETSSLLFEELIMGFGSNLENLDDGESATIAYAQTTKSTALLDEKKGLNLCSRELPTLKTATSFDLFTHNQVIKHLGLELVRESLQNALIFARMRIIPEHYDVLIQIVGPEFAKTCASLPTTLRNQL